jgi:hypothetical protein
MRGAPPPEIYHVCSVGYSFGTERKRENAGGFAPAPRSFLCICGLRVVCVWFACGVRVVCLLFACCSPDGCQFFILFAFLAGGFAPPYPPRDLKGRGFGGRSPLKNTLASCNGTIDLHPATDIFNVLACRHGNHLTSLWYSD